MTLTSTPCADHGGSVGKSGQQLALIGRALGACDDAIVTAQHSRISPL